MKLVTVYNAPNAGDAELIRSRLESAGFTVFVKSEDQSLVLDLFAHVQVPEEQAENARALLTYQAPAAS